MWALEVAAACAGCATLALQFLPLQRGFAHQD